MSFLTRAYNFVRRYLFKNPLYIMVYGAVFWRRNFAMGAHLYTEAEIADQIKSGKSLLRIGDGEINLLLGLRNHYQTFDRGLQKSMWSIVRSYSSQSPYVLAVPRFINMTNDELRKIGKFNVWLPLKVMFWLYFNKQASYLDAHVFYYDEYFDRVISPCIAGRRVLFVTNKQTLDFQANNPNLPFTFDRLETPETESIGAEESIEAGVREYVNNHRGESVMVLLAAGPVGKAIGYRLALSGIQCLDIGKVAEVMHTGESIEYFI